MQSRLGTTGRLQLLLSALMPALCISLPIDIDGISDPHLHAQARAQQLRERTSAQEHGGHGAILQDAECTGQWPFLVGGNRVERTATTSMPGLLRGQQRSEPR